MQQKTIYVNEKLIKQYETEDLDLALNQEFGVNYDDESDDWTSVKLIKLDRHYAPDGYIVKLDTILNAIQGMKEQGATHLRMDYHCDHISYQIAGYKLELADSAEMEKRAEAERKAKLEKERARLEKELERINNSL